MKVAAIAVTALCSVGTAQAYKFDMGPDSPWEINLDNSLQWSMGWRMQDLDSRIGNHPFFAEGDYKFKDSGDMITNRIQDLIEFQGAYKGFDGHTMGFRTTASVWKDFAYNDSVKTNPSFCVIPGCGVSYTGGKYSDYTKRYFMEGGEILDAFVYDNFDIAGTPVYVKAGRLSQYWGNAFYYGFSNIAYSQQPIDFIKGFSQPGSEVKELFLPRKQILIAADLSNEVSVAAQYFLEFRPNRYPEAGTYFGFFDILFNGNQNSGFLFNKNDGMQNPPENNHNYGLKLTWSPEWAGGDMGFYYRQLDEVDPWILINPTDGHLQTRFAQKVKLVGFSYEKTFGLYSVGFELNKRIGTALNTMLSAPGDHKGAAGDIINFDINTFVQLGTTPLWDSGILLVELAGTHLQKVTQHAEIYSGVGNAAAGCATAESWRDGCSTKDWTALWFLFDPQWLQVFPGIDLDMPVSYSYGLNGNSAIRASGFYAQQSNIYSVGIKATYQSKHSLGLSYQGYNWRTNKTGPNGLGGNMYAGFGGAGPVSINDRGWLQLQFKTSF